MNRNAVIVILAVALLALSACAPAGPPATSQPIQIKVGILSYMTNSPFVIAQEEGFFAEQGLEVEIVNFGSSDREMLPAVLQGQLDVAATAVNVAVLSGIAQGSNARFVADKGFINPQAPCATDGWVASKALLDAGALDDLAGLEGRKFAFFPANTIELAADLLLERAGLSQSDIEIIDIVDQGTRVEAMANGTLDLTVLAEPWITRAKKSGGSDLWMPFSELIPNYSVGSVIYGPGMLERDPEVGTRFLLAYLKAIQQFNEGKTDRNVEIVAEFTQLPAEEVREICWPSFQPDGKIYAQGLTDFEQWARAKGYIDHELSLDQIWDPQFVEQAYDRLHE